MSDNRFNLQFNFQKAMVDADENVAYLEGIASGPEVDLLNERMSPQALESMVKSIRKGTIEFRDVHEGEWNAELGEVVDLYLTDDNHLFYRAKLDLNISAARDLVYRITKQGKKLGVSVGGKIKKAGYEYVAELGKSIYTYFDVQIDHIGITRQAVYHHSFADVVLKSLSTIERSQKPLPDEVYDLLSENYPAKVLGWVKKAQWEKRQSVSLDSIDMARRPGGRDPEKVNGIAEAIEAGKRMDPVVLVDDGSDKLQIADGYHRTLAYQHLKKSSIAAYVASGLEPGGPWEKTMHDEKLNKSLDTAEADQEEATKADGQEAAAEATVAEDTATDTTETNQETVAAEEQSDATQTEGQKVETEEAKEDAAEQSDAEAQATEDETKAGEGAEEAATAATSDEATANEPEVTKALTDAQAEVATLQKSLSDTEAKVDELTKSLSTKTEEATTLQKSLDETTQELETVKKSLAEKETELEKRDSRKAIVFGKFDGVEMVEKAAPAPTNQSPTLKRWLSS